MGWQGKILRVDLTAGTANPEPLNMEWAQEYLGLRGLATRYLYEEMDPAVDALSPENKIVYATGPLTGTMASTGGRYAVVTKGALTDAIACSNSGGYFGAELKFAGWDMIIVEGKSRHPVYLYIQDDHAELLDARNFIWGDTVWDAEDKIRARHQDPQIRMALIGRAGEVGVRYACVINDRDRAAGRSGVGAVMGSKQLKAIAVRGTQGVQVHDGQAFLKAVATAREKLDPHPARARLSRFGTMPMLDVTNSYGALPTRNSQDVQFESTAKVNARAMQTKRKTDGQTNLITNKACFGCTIGCGRVSKLDPTHFSVKDPEKAKRYGGAIGGIEYESGFAFAPLLGIDDLEAVTFANAICNEDGMDPISLGGSIAAAMELFQEGVITTDDTGGLDLSWGNAEALVRLSELAATGEGFGKDIGLGAKRLCEKWGRPEFSMTVKGQEFPGYDVRAMQGMGLAYATSSRGACHMRATPFTDDFAHVRPDGKAKIVLETQDFNAAVDATGLCAFTKNAWVVEDYAAQVDAACEGEWTPERLTQVGERIYNLERQFNLKAGLTKADDTLPQRLLKEAAKSGAGKGHVLQLDAMLPEYYELRGWSADGVPTAETLGRLGIEG